MCMCICSFVPLVSRWPVGPNCQAPSLPPTSDGIIRHVRKIRLHQRAHYAVTKWYILDSCLQGQRAQNMFGSSKAVRCNLCIVQLCTNGNPAPKYQRPHPQAIASRHIWAHCEYSPHTLCVSKGGSDSLSHLLWSPDVRDLEYGFVPPRLPAEYEDQSCTDISNDNMTHWNNDIIFINQTLWTAQHHVWKSTETLSLANKGSLRMASFS